VDILLSHIAFYICAPLGPVWAGLRLISLIILATSNESVGWLTKSGLVVGCGRSARVVHDWVSPMFGLSLDSFDL
jgi:hypothetical protein